MTLSKEESEGDIQETEGGIGAKVRLPQDGTQWHADYSELKIIKTKTQEKILNFPHNCLKRI